MINNPSKWTRFNDMHSGGVVKIYPFECIYIEADQETAELIFSEQFHRDPNNITCSCCGNDYSISEYDSLADATEYDRTSFKGEVIPLDEFIKNSDCLFLFKKTYLIGEVQ